MEETDVLRKRLVLNQRVVDQALTLGNNARNERIKGAQVMIRSWVF